MKYVAKRDKIGVLLHDPLAKSRKRVRVSFIERKSISRGVRPQLHGRIVEKHDIDVYQLSNFRRQQVIERIVNLTSPLRRRCPLQKHAKIKIARGTVQPLSTGAEKNQRFNAKLLQAVIFFLSELHGR